jgi:hypothetical protein
MVDVCLRTTKLILSKNALDVDKKMQNKLMKTDGNPLDPHKFVVPIQKGFTGTSCTLSPRCTLFLSPSKSILPFRRLVDFCTCRADCFALFPFLCQSYVTVLSFILLLWGRLRERVTVTDVYRLYNLYEHVNTQQLISE